MTGPRMGRAAVVLFVVSLLQCKASPAVAQAATGDGIDAFLHGDYQRAAQILKPIAERCCDPFDAPAAFFMAALYENALGLPRDPARACALYARSSAVRDGTDRFARLNGAMFAALEPALTENERDDCLMLSAIGFDHRFEPATFDLAPGHSIAIDLTRRPLGVHATVAYEGKEKRTELPVALTPGVAFLPFQHVDLDVGGPAPVRHFVEAFTWVPGPAAARWQLRWWLLEVVRGDVVTVTSDDLVTAKGDVAPRTPLSDLGRLVTVRLNDAGAAEWAILAGPNAGSGVIETDAERQEVRTLEETRRAADERVDWKQVRDPARSPSFVYADANGCGNVSVYGWSADRTEAAAVNADGDALQLSTTPRTFDLAVPRRELDVSVVVFEGPQRSWPFCTDVWADDGGRQETWKAIGGAITLQMSPPGVRARQPGVRRVTIQIEAAEFVNSSGTRVRAPGPIRLVALTGTVPGGNQP